MHGDAVRCIYSNKCTFHCWHKKKHHKTHISGCDTPCENRAGVIGGVCVSAMLVTQERKEED